ncbi:MAG: BofC C-terminal domain-containing protein [Halanaerobiales bacterium]
MSKLYKRAAIIIISLFTIILFWNEIDPLYLQRGNYQNDNKPLINLSILPDNISSSLVKLNERASKLQEEISARDTFFLENIKLAGEKYISSHTPLIVQTYYKKSNSLEQQIVSMPENFVGLTIKELNEIAENWEIKEYTPGKLMIIYRSFDDVSPEDKGKMHLGVKEGRIAIFYGSSGQKNLKKQTDIPVGELPPEEQENLRKGIEVNSDEELLAILDSIISSINSD